MLTIRKRNTLKVDLLLIIKLLACVAMAKTIGEERMSIAWCLHVLLRSIFWGNESITHLEMVMNASKCYLVLWFEYRVCWCEQKCHV